VREAPRTLYTLSRAGQRGIDSLSYEVIAIDNGSTMPLGSALVEGFSGPGAEFHHVLHSTRSPSPVEAINIAVGRARGRYVVVMIDGAHMVSPGVLGGMAAAWRAYPEAFVATLPLHLGPGAQNYTVPRGYNQGVEDALLAQFDWQRDGYELFRAAGGTSDGSMGWFGALYESNCFGVPKAAFERLGGFHPGFMSPGGGLVNLDFFRIAVECAELAYVLLLGEASFHQYHGGVTSNVPVQMHPWEMLHAEYVRIRGKAHARPVRRPILLGSMPRQAIGLGLHSANMGMKWWSQVGG